MPHPSNEPSSSPTESSTLLSSSETAQTAPEIILTPYGNRTFVFSKLTNIQPVIFWVGLVRFIASKTMMMMMMVMMMMMMMMIIIAVMKTMTFNNFTI